MLAAIQAAQSLLMCRAVTTGRAAMRRSHACACSTRSSDGLCGGRDECGEGDGALDVPSWEPTQGADMSSSSNHLVTRFRLVLLGRVLMFCTTSRLASTLLQSNKARVNRTSLPLRYCLRAPMYGPVSQHIRWSRARRSAPLLMEGPYWIYWIELDL